MQVMQASIPGVALVRLPFDILAQAAAGAYVLTVIALADAGILGGRPRPGAPDKGLPAGFTPAGTASAADEQPPAPAGFGFQG